MAGSSRQHYLVEAKLGRRMATPRPVLWYYYFLFFLLIGSDDVVRGEVVV